MVNRPRACLNHTPMAELLETLRQASPPVHDDERDDDGTAAAVVQRRALLWVYTITVDCWSVSSHQTLTTEVTDLTQQMAVKFPETRNWTADDFRALGREFLWTENISRSL
jgi:hypothetical protein